VTDWAPTPISTSFGAEEIGWQALGPSIACATLATIVVASRWYTRYRLARCIGVDDVIILFSMMLAWCMCAIVGVERNEGLGVYKGNRDIDAQHLAKLVIINNNLWAVAVNVTKASILAQYLRLFSSRSTRFVCYFLLVLLIPVLCWSVFAGTFLCTPVAKLWKPHLPGHCMNPRQYWLSAAAINIGMDFTVLLLPLPAITQLRLPRKQKLCLILMFLLGFFVCVVSVVRLAVVNFLESSGRLVESGIQAVIWSVVEVNIGIICASLIALKPLLLHFCPRLLNDTSVPSHCLRLPEMQTMTDEDATSGFCTNTSSPIMPLAPCLQAARGKDHQPSMTQRAGGSAILPAVLC